MLDRQTEVLSQQGINCIDVGTESSVVPMQTSQQRLDSSQCEITSSQKAKVTLKKEDKRTAFSAIDACHTGENRRFDHRILDWTSWTASKETSLEDKVLVVFKRSKYINIS